MKLGWDPVVACWLHLSTHLEDHSNDGLARLPFQFLPSSCSIDSNKANILRALCRWGFTPPFCEDSAQRHEQPSTHKQDPSSYTTFPFDGWQCLLDPCCSQLSYSISELRWLFPSYHSSKPWRSTFLNLLVLRGQPDCSSKVHNCSYSEAHKFVPDHTML